jgi:hypothetical protein
LAVPVPGQAVSLERRAKKAVVGPFSLWCFLTLKFGSGRIELKSALSAKPAGEPPFRVAPLTRPTGFGKSWIDYAARNVRSFLISAWTAFHGS